MPTHIQKINIIAHFNLNIVDLMNGLNQINVFTLAEPHEKSQLHTKVNFRDIASSLFIIKLGMPDYVHVI